MVVLVTIWTNTVGPSGVYAILSEPSVVRTPETSFSHLKQVGYPWKPQYLHLHYPGLPSPLRVHYIDEGSRQAKETLLLLHGTPAWSYLYRFMIPVFVQAQYRVVALDNIGFGRSDKLTDPASYSHDLHVETVRLVVQSLDLKGITAVLHDLGGPTGVSALRRDPERYRRVVLLNTWLPQGDVLTRPFEHVAYLAWRTLVTVLGRHTPIQTVFKVATGATSSAVSLGYGAPYPSYLYTAGPAFWPLMVPLTPDDPVAREMKASAAFLQRWEGEALVGYSDREVFTLAGRSLLLHVLPQACDVQIEDAGHFLQEDQGPSVALIIKEFIEGRCVATRRQA
ncbi:hypothetical protein Pmani_002656 [Petrolisthes manimaculis]|uniref:AB hydrolase-1 domain-containing protein n=1 Tax=Petrolisthes manimaculis TaxID=1843537 RepID=A0AAE1UNA4_9EUCA|nr:hypothetical protein Pmani_002656 [Petrolisthes manimaculis]